MSLIQQIGAFGVFARANTVLFERPDRLSRAVLAAAPYGRSILGGVAASTARYPQASAFVSPHGRLTYQDLWRTATGLARGLRDHEEVTESSRVGVLCRNTPLFVQALLAGSMLGADLVFLNTGLAVPQLAEVVGTEGVDVVVHDEEFADVVAASPARRVGSTRARELIEASSTDDLPKPPRVGGLVTLTSGTTGLPKGAQREGEASLTGVAALLGTIPIRARDSVVVPAPFFHAWGLSGLLIGLSLSCTIVARPHFDAERTLIDVAANRAQVLLVVPTMLRRLCELDPAVVASTDVRSLRVLASSGSAVPRQVVLDALERFGPILYNVYGSTEVATASIARPADLLADPGTAGRPAKGVRVRVLDANDAPVPAGVSGRVAVGNDARFSGYTGGGTKDVVDDLMLTGDIGHFDERGRLFIDGREDDMIVSGGENLYPLEVEELLAEHEDVAEAVVVGVPDEEFGQALKAFVVLRPGRQADAEALREYVKARLARFKVPREVTFLDEFPRTATGKVQRRRLA
jgi:fatty-acyl-CoA synthase